MSTAADDLREQVRETYAEAAGFEQVSVEFTHEVADSLHGAIVKAVRSA